MEELEKTKNEVSLELYKSREDKKTFLELQVKDSKKIALLNKEKEKIEEQLKKHFSDNYPEQIFSNKEKEDNVNNKNTQSQKYAQSVQLNDDEEESKEKIELQKQVKKLKNKNDKLNQENKKLKISMEELEKTKNEVSLELYKSREDKKTFLELQVKDSKKIALLNKEKEKLKKENNKIKTDLENLKQRLSDIEQENDRLSNLNSNLQQQLKFKGIAPSKIEESKIDIKSHKVNLDEQKQNQFLVPASNIMINADDLLNTLIKFVMGKNINLKKHLLRYDISKNGKITKKDFKRAIEELKIGFLSYDLEKLANACKLPNSDYISIEQFLNVLKNKNEDFKKFLEEYSDGKDRLIKSGDKQASRKYDNFENKEFNIDY